MSENENTDIDYSLQEGETFGGWIGRIREGKRLKVTDCARVAGMAHSKWSRLEADEPRRKNGQPGTPNRETVYQVAKGLACDPNKALMAALYLPDNWNMMLLSRGSVISTGPDGSISVGKDTAYEARRLETVTTRLEAIATRLERLAELSQTISPPSV